MRESRYDLLCTILHGLGQLCMFTVVKMTFECVVNLLYQATTLNQCYTKSAVVSLVTNVANLIAPWALGYLGSKNSLVLGSLLFSLHMSTFFFVHFIPFYVTSALLGFGFALYYTGQSGYLTEHSTTMTIERNSSLSWALSTSCMTIGGIILLLAVKSPEDAINSSSGLSNETNIAPRERNFSDSEIRIIYGALLSVTMLSNVIFASLPERPVKNSITVVNRKHRDGFVEQLKKIVDTVKEKPMIQLIPLFGYTGLSASIFNIVYPTTLSYTSKLASNVHLPAYYSIAFGLSNLMMGFAIGTLFERFTTLLLLIIGTFSNSIAMILIFLSTPMWATREHTTEDTLLIEPNIYLALLIAVLFGIGDNCVNTARSVICASMLQEKQPQVFAISKFHQTLIQAIILFISPFIPIYAYFVVMMCYGISTGK